MALALVNNPTASEPRLTETELDAAIVAAWAQHRDLLRQRRETNKATAPDLARTRAELGAYLYEKQAMLAGRGREGDFRPWLRDHNIPASSAYRLLRRHANGGKCPTGTLSPASPAVELRGLTLTLALTPHEAVTLHEALTQYPNLPDPNFRITKSMLDAISIYPMWPNLGRIQQNWRARPDSFTPEQAAALPPIRIPAATPAPKKEVKPPAKAAGAA